MFYICEGQTDEVCLEGCNARDGQDEEKEEKG